MKVIGNIGDSDPFDYGGHVVYKLISGGKEYIESEYWEESHRGIYTVYRWTLEKDARKDLDWVDDEEWAEVAGSMGLAPERILEMARSQDPMDRAVVYEFIGSHFGFENLDSYPERYTLEEMEKRWPEFA